MKTAITENEANERVLKFKRALRSKVDEVPDDLRTGRGLVLRRADLDYLEGQIDFLLAAHFRAVD